MTNKPTFNAGTTPQRNLVYAWEGEVAGLRAEIARLTAAIAYVRQRSARACEILNEFDNTRHTLESKPLTGSGGAGGNMIASVRGALDPKP